MSNSSSLDVYWGGFLLNSCTPLELTLNWCSHNCAYCFANLNDPDRKANIKQAIGLLSELWHTNSKGQWKRQSYAAYLLRSGYGVSISNHVDLLASSNVRQGLPVVEMLVEMGIPLCLMTRWGKAQDVQHLFDLIEGRPTPFYSSVPTLNADIAKQCEPGAPPPEQRLAFIAEAVKRGHPVEVGINPLIPGWIDDPLAHAKAIKATGAHSVILGKLHISQRQLKEMPDRAQQALGEYAIGEAMQSTKSVTLHELYEAVKAACWSVGLQCYTAQQKERSDAFEPAKALHPKHFPLLQDFVNHCHDNKQPGEYVYFEEFHDFFVSKLPQGVWGLRDHINAMTRPEVLYGKGIPQKMNYSRLLHYVWKHPETIYCAANVDCFAFAGDRMKAKKGDRTSNQWIEVQDANQMPILVFLPDGTANQLYTDQHSL